MWDARSKTLRLWGASYPLSRHLERKRGKKKTSKDGPKTFLDLSPILSFPSPRSMQATQHGWYVIFFFFSFPFSLFRSAMNGEWMVVTS